MRAWWLVLVACCGTLIAPITSVVAAPARVGVAPVYVNHVVVGKVTGSRRPPVNAGAVEFLTARRGFVVSYDTCPPNSPCGFQLLRTSNAGRSWTVVNRGLDLSSLSFTSSAEGYALDAQGRLRKTEDGGRRWSVAEAVGGRYWSVDFVDHAHGWLFGQTLYRTTDGGRTWQKLTFGCNPMARLGLLSFVSTKVGFLSCEEGSGPFVLTLYRTFDGGETWAKVAAIGVVHDAGPMQFLTNRTGFVSAGFGDLLETSDGGRHLRSVPNTPFEDVSAISWQTGRSGYVDSHGNLMHTADGGRHWAQVYPSPVPTGPIALNTAGAGVGAGTGWFQDAILRIGNAATWHFAGRLVPWTALGSTVDQLVRDTAGHLWAVANSLSGSSFRAYVFRSDDGGTSWQRMLSVPGGNGYLSLVSKNVGFFATTSPFRLYTTVNGGRAWTGRPESNHIWNIQFVSRSSGWAYQAGGVLVHTSDGGRGWTRVPFAVEDFRTDNLYMLSAADQFITGTQCFSKTCRPIILRTRNAGQSWTKILLPKSFAGDGFDWVTPKIGFVLLGATLYRTTDAGVTWSTVNG